VAGEAERERCSAMGERSRREGGWLLPSLGGCREWEVKRSAWQRECQDRERHSLIRRAKRRRYQRGPPKPEPKVGREGAHSPGGLRVLEPGARPEGLGWRIEDCAGNPSALFWMYHPPEGPQALLETSPDLTFLTRNSRARRGVASLSLLLDECINDTLGALTSWMQAVSVVR